jgi:hypothetical protein
MSDQIVAILFTCTSSANYLHYGHLCVKPAKRSAPLTSDWSLHLSASFLKLLYCTLFKKRNEKSNDCEIFCISTERSLIEHDTKLMGYFVCLYTKLIKI